MSTEPNNPNAFPCAPLSESYFNYTPEFGMTLRDYFAGQAMAGILASRCEEPPSTSNETLASAFYELADAMLAEREKQPEKE